MIPVVSSNLTWATSSDTLGFALTGVIPDNELALLSIVQL
jgi:hypothetical protein